MGGLESIVVLDAHAGMRKDKNGNEQEYNAEADGESSNANDGRMRRQEEIPSEENEKSHVPESGCNSPAAVNPTVRVHFCEQASAPERERLWPGAENKKHGVDDMLVSYNHAGKEIGRYGDRGVLRRKRWRAKEGPDKENGECNEISEKDEGEDTAIY